MKKSMRKSLLVSILIMSVVLLSACGASSYEMSGSANKVTIKAHAEDGKYGEGFVMDISKKEMIKIDSQLEEGELQIEINEVMNTATGDEMDDYQILSTIKTLNIKPGDQVDLIIDYAGEFMPCFTAIGKTNGTVIISIVKQ